MDSEHKDFFPILKTGVRLLRPYEFKKIYDVIPKIDLKDKFEALLYSGCRYSELRWLYNNKDSVKGNILIIPSQKKEARHKERYVRLNTNGQRAITYFLRSEKNLPDYPRWDENLIRWCEKAKLDKTGVCCKTNRKTWECWLATMYPNSLQQIFLNQGHTEKISMEYYLMVPFNDQDKQDMRFYTDGWI